MNRKASLQFLLLLLALVMIAAGILNGSMWDMWVKATNLCRECVGIG